MSVTEQRKNVAPPRKDGSRPAAGGSGKRAPDSARRRTPRASAGRCLAVGLACFGIWLLLDANQLYRSAEASPLGSRRTVSMIILRPIAAVTNAVGLSSLVSSADDALGKANGPGSDQVSSDYTPPPLPVPFDGQIGVDDGMPPAPHRIFGFRLPTYTPPKPVGPPPVPQPTAAHPLVMLDIGDSIGEDLGFGLGDQFGGDNLVVLHQTAVESTGLARPDYYDWPYHLQQYLKQYHPNVVVAMFGANDAQNFIQSGQGVVFGSSLWRTDYAERVAQIMQEVTSAGAHLLWVGMPIMQDPGFSHQMLEVNAIYAAQAAAHPGVTYVSTWKLFSNSAGQYSAYLSAPGGRQIDARSADGVHLDPGGWDYLASALVAPMERAWGISLGH
jgi:lysophospholipase L1-like esterase